MADSLWTFRPQHDQHCSARQGGICLGPPTCDAELPGLKRDADASTSFKTFRSDDPLEGANCSLCGDTADNFHVPDNVWERVGLGPVQACFKCFRIAAWHVGIRPETAWQVSL